MVEITLTQDEYDLLDDALGKEDSDLKEDPECLTEKGWEAWNGLMAKTFLLDPKRSRPSNTIVRDIS